MKKAICLTLWKSMVLLCVAAYLPTAAAAKLRPEVVLSADQLLEVRGFLAFFVERFEAEKLLRKTRAGLQAMSLYLTEVPDRTKRSKPGQWINASISCLAKETEADLSKVPASEVQAMQEKFLAAQAEPVA